MRIGFCRSALICLVGMLCFQSCHSQQAPNHSFLQEATSAPPTSFYDYIIIGGGTAGCPLAATLSQNSRVLLVERGGSPYGNPKITSIASFADTLYDASPSSPSQQFVSQDGVVNCRARVLGGGTCLNAGFYTHATADYFLKAEWDAKLVNESYRWVEEAVVHEPPVLQWQSAMRDGLLEAGLTPYNGFTYEHIYGTKVGGTIFDKDGHRHTAADLLQYANPDHLAVLLHATVHRIIFLHKGTKPMAHGVVFTDAKGAEHFAYLNNGLKSEIIVSAGAIGSPHLLMLSGIGPAEQLRSLGINVVLDQPMVGQGMADNPMNAVFVPSPSPIETSLVQVVGITRFGAYIEGSSGINIGGFSAVAPHSQKTSSKDFNTFSSQADQPSSTVTSDEITLNDISKAMKRINNSFFRGAFLLEKVTGPLSRGHLEVVNQNVNDNPKVTFNYFKEPLDLRRCVEGMKTIAKVIDSEAFSRFRYAYLSVQELLNLTARNPTNLRPRHNNVSTSLEQYCIDTVLTIWHYHGGCQVGSVVDQDYRVLGVDALRVVDGSTFNSSPGTNPQATVMMLGREDETSRRQPTVYTQNPASTCSGHRSTFGAPPTPPGSKTDHRRAHRRGSTTNSPW